MAVGAGGTEAIGAGPHQGVPDLSACAREPIHIPGAIQPHGVLLVVDGDGVVRVASANAGAGLGLDASPLGAPLHQVLGGPAAARVQDALAKDGAPPMRLQLADGSHWDVTLGDSPDGALVELEHAGPEDPASISDLYARVRSALARLQRTRTVDALFRAMAESVRDLTGMDRVMVYRFDDDWNGEVVAESRAEAMDAYLGLRFPASDIPAQARELYRHNWLRLIAAVDYEPVPLEPAEHPLTGAPVDLSGSLLRSVSPVHLEYLRNMRVSASMSISLLRTGELWGLVACHHPSPRRVPAAVRSACEFLGQTFSVQLGVLLEEGRREAALTLTRIENAVLDRIGAAADWLEALTTGDPALEAVAGASGAALRIRDRVVLSGSTPPREAVLALTEWLAEGEDVFVTDRLGESWAAGDAIASEASGVLSLALRPGGTDWLLWFRPEVVRTIEWAGDPAKPVEASDAGAPRLHPRRSFGAWVETVRGRAEPWPQHALDAARTLRAHVVDIVLRRVEETERLNEELRRSNEELDAFNWIAGHDLKEPLRGLRTYARYLQKGEGTDTAAVQDRMVRLAGHMDGMLDALLDYSRAHHLEIERRPTDLGALVENVLEVLRPRIEEAGADIRISRPLPRVACDPVRVSSIYQNLLSNALKYRSADPEIEIGWSGTGEEPVFFVRDNGIGIPEEHAEAVFRLFRRLHPPGRYGGGAGAGLAIARRLVERHGGRLWLESAEGRGTTFLFTLGRTAG